MGITVNVNGMGKIDFKTDMDNGSVDVRKEADMPSVPSATQTAGDYSTVRISAKSDSQGLDQGYKYVVEIILNLNHDRYKSYFNYFIVLHLGIVAAMRGDFGKIVSNASLCLTIIGIVLSLGWLAVLYKIQKDIGQAWSLIRDYENSSQYTQRVKVSETGWMCFRASSVMLLIPFGFFAFYVFALTT